MKITKEQLKEIQEVISGKSAHNAAYVRPDPDNSEKLLVSTTIYNGTSDPGEIVFRNEGVKHPLHEIRAMIISELKEAEYQKTLS